MSDIRATPSTPTQILNQGSSMDQETRIKAKVKAREDAREIAEMLSWGNGTGADYAESFLKELRSRLPVKESAKPPTPLAPIPIARLGAVPMPFGEHRDKPLDDVPLQYLEWLCGKQEEFLQGLRAYLKHPELEARRRAYTP